MTEPAVPTPPLPRRGAPAPLLVAASLAGVEALLLVGFGFVELAASSADRPLVGPSTALFFLIYGAGLGWCAWSLTRLHSWSRSPVVLAQLLQLGVAWWGRDGWTTPIAVALAVTAVVVLVGIFHPSSLEALADDD